MHVGVSPAFTLISLVSQKSSLALKVQGALLPVVSATGRKTSQGLKTYSACYKPVVKVCSTYCKSNKYFWLHCTQGAEITVWKFKARCPFKDRQLSRGQGHTAQVHRSCTFTRPPSLLKFASLLTGTLNCFQETASLMVLPSHNSVHAPLRTPTALGLQGCHCRTRCRYGNAICNLLLPSWWAAFSTPASMDLLQCIATEKTNLINNKQHWCSFVVKVFKSTQSFKPTWKNSCLFPKSPCTL